MERKYIDIVVGIDGTGSSNWRGENGGYSHVFSFYNSYKSKYKKYFDGPKNEVTGSDCEVILKDAYLYIKKTINEIHNLSFQFNANDYNVKYNAYELGTYFQGYTNHVNLYKYNTQIDKTKIRVIIAGHSRGGHIAIKLASMLDLPVYLLALYDAVDMNYQFNSTTIVNVVYTFHALRSRYIHSRDSFGNTGRNSTAVYLEKEFSTSHGGVGGALDSIKKAFNPLQDTSCTSFMEVYLPGILGFDKYIIPIPNKIATVCIDESKAVHNWILTNARDKGLNI